MCPLHGPGHDINSFKLVQAQANGTKSTWSSACDGGSGRIRLQGAKKRQAECEDLNYLVTNAVKEILKANKHLNAKAANDSISEEEQENFNFEDLKIGEEWYNGRKKQSNDAEVPETGMEAKKELYKIIHLVNPTEKGK